jgi:hypothetical protein
MRLSLFRGGYTTLISSETIDDWNEFCDLVTDAKIGPKNGDYFVRGYCEGERKDANIQTIDLVVIDGDQLLDNGHTCCPPQLVHDALRQASITHVIYNSYSNDLVNNRHKWRLCLPCPDVIDAETLAQAVAEVLTLLHENKIFVRNVKENLVLSQPWFTPRCPDERTLDDFYKAWHDGDPWRLNTIVTAITPTAGLDIEFKEGKGAEAGHFSWDYVISQFQAGTIHQGIKSVCGWLCYSTDWADSQIKQYLITHIQALCPDAAKVKRACETKEIDNLIKYCREKQGVVNHAANWKDHLTTAAELGEKDFPPIRWAVDGIIPEGLTILAGDPKVGKSLTCIDICTAIGTGGLAFGNRNCVQGVSVYISLEDPARRVKERIEQQSNQWPDRFKLLTGGVPLLGPEFHRLLDEMILLWPDMRCIIIDTMQYVYPQKPSNESDYVYYTKQLDPLHKWALENHVAIVGLTHCTKTKTADGENPFQAILGSVGIQGAADALLMLRKNYAKGGIANPDLADGFLNIRGREQGEEVLALDFDSEALKWSLRGEVRLEDMTANANWLIVSACLKDSRKTPAEVIAFTKLNKSTVKSCLRRMLDAKMLDKDSKGAYGIAGKEYIEPGSKW